MRDTGAFRVPVSVENPARRGSLRALDNVLVDTGSDLTWIPRQVLQDLGITAERRYRFVTATGDIVEREIGFAIIGIGVVAWNPEQHRRHAEGQRDVARSRVTRFDEIHIRWR